MQLFDAATGKPLDGACRPWANQPNRGYAGWADSTNQIQWNTYPYAKVDREGNTTWPELGQVPAPVLDPPLEVPGAAPQTGADTPGAEPGTPGEAPAGPGSAPGQGSANNGANGSAEDSNPPAPR